MVLSTRILAVPQGSHPGAEHQLLLFFSVVKMGNPAAGYRPVACKCRVVFFFVEATAFLSGDASGVERYPMTKGCLAPVPCV